MKGKIYKITNGNETYYGSTVKTLNQRLTGHKYEVKKGKMLYKKSLLESPNCKIELIEEIEFENIKELYSRERFYVENNECINCQTPGLSRKETSKKYSDSHKEERKLHYQKCEKERRKTIFKTCSICNLEMLAHSYSNHLKSKKHNKNIFDNIANGKIPNS
tara:strand:+ start:235 stop:720 length:486 start_codon:yes stop_codon:yes gene_type:complete